MIHYTYTCDGCQTTLDNEDLQEFAKAALGYLQQHNGNAPQVKDEAFCRKCLDGAPLYWDLKAQELTTIAQESVRRLENFRRRYFAKR